MTGAKSTRVRKEAGWRQGRPNRRKGNLRRRRVNVALIASFTILAIMSCLACFSPLIAPHDPGKQNLRQSLRPPAWEHGGMSEHLLGTDYYGRDIASQLVYGARVSLLVGVAAVLVAGTVGTFLGAVSGFYGRKLGTAIMGLTDLQLAFPFILLAMVMGLVLGKGLINVILVLAIAGWPTYARLAYGQTLQLQSEDYVMAARAIGVGPARILFVHILPNMMGPLTVVASFSVAQMIVLEASLSFLGMGIGSDLPTWGRMLADGREFVAAAWWMATFPGIAIMAIVLAINIIGDWLRDRVDPTQRARN